ncbi:MAG: respiratory nitrate reductase subunit gamma [Gammaproteobacteria bacterium]|jgi:nitrate reductase gamma subunit
MFTDFVEGPFWYFSLTVFVVGVAWRLVSILRLGVRQDLAVPRESGAAGGVRAIFSRFLPRRTIRDRALLPIIAGYMFHVGLFAVLFFAQPHVDFYMEYITGFGWTAMPRWLFILSAEIAFAGLIMLWLYRVLHPVTKMLSGADEHIASWLVFLVMLTGCLALLERFDSLRVIHFFLAELLLIYFPFSGLMHTFSFLFSRGYTGATMHRRGVDA